MAMIRLIDVILIARAGENYHGDVPESLIGFDFRQQL